MSKSRQCRQPVGRVRRARDQHRWNMYTASPPGNSRRFSVHQVGETVRKFANTLWNTYSFFVHNLSDWAANGEQSRRRC